MFVPFSQIARFEFSNIKATVERHRLQSSRNVHSIVDTRNLGWVTSGQ